MTTVLFDSNAIHHFASPYLSPDPSFAEFMVGEHARGVLEVALGHCEGETKQAGSGTPDSIARALGQPLPWSIAVSPELVTLKSVLATRPDPARILECLDPILQAWARHEAVVGPGAADAEPPGGRSRPTARFDESTFTLYSAAEESPWRRPGDRPPLNKRLPEAIATIEAAGEIIRRVSPRFSSWVGKAIRDIVLLETVDGNLWSSGDSVCPGVVYLSFPASRFDIANLLVHEAAHQYYIALGGVADLHDGSDTKLYFSPALNRDRPIEMILYAFHAFANVALFESDLLAAEHHTTIGGENREALDLGRLEVLYTHLTETESLTDMGHVLCDPLAERLLGR